MLGVRDLFENFFRAETPFGASLPSHLRSQFFRYTKPKMIRWGFSDTYIVAVPLMYPGEPTGSAAGVLRTLFAAATMWLNSLSAGHPIRGGIEIGLGIDIAALPVFGYRVIYQ